MLMVCIECLRFEGHIEIDVVCSTRTRPFNVVAAPFPDAGRQIVNFHRPVWGNNWTESFVVTSCHREALQVADQYQM